MLVTIPAGSTLYHGTIEKFPVQKLGTGSYDQVLWTSDSPAIAQTYIPTAGLTIYAGPEALAGPLDHPVSGSLAEVQKAIGIDYQYGSPYGPIYDRYGRATSYSVPVGWDHFPTAEEVEQRLAVFGITREHHWRPFELRISEGRLLKTGEFAWGRLLAGTAQEDLTLFDNTLGGERESDLMNVEYHQIGLFRWAEQQGYDGIKINDFAQSNLWGNVGHYSFGLFHGSLHKLDWTSIPAQHWNWETWEELQSGTTPHLDAWHRGG